MGHNYAWKNSLLVPPLICFLQFLINFLPFSFLQSHRDSVGCTPQCYGVLQSVSAAVSFLGALIVGKMSDCYGRRIMVHIGLIFSVLSHAAALSKNDQSALFMAALASGFNQNYSVLKAVVSDFYTNRDRLEEDRRNREKAMGYLGAAAGLAFMVGPLLGSALFSSYQDARHTSLLAIFTVALLVPFLPPDYHGRRGQSKAPAEVSRKGVLHYIYMWFVTFLAAHTHQAKLLLALRFMMGLAYSIYNGIFMLSLRARLGFSPSDYGLLMAWVGMSHAFAQGIFTTFASFFVKRKGNLLSVCSLVVLAGRFIQIKTSSLLCLYGVTFCIIMAVGVINTVLSSATAEAATIGSIGSLYGSMEAVEKIAALVGPLIGAYCFGLYSLLPTIASGCLYATISAVTYGCFDRYFDRNSNYTDYAANHKLRVKGL